MQNIENKYSVSHEDWAKLGDEGQNLFNRIYEASLKRRKEFVNSQDFPSECRTQLEQAISKAMSIVSYEAVQQLQTH